MIKESLESKVPVFLLLIFQYVKVSLFETCYSRNITVNRILCENKVGSPCAFLFLRGHKGVNPFVVY